MNILVIVNEPLEKMAIGSNTTLAYILGAVQQNHDIYIYQVIDEKIPLISEKINAIHLNIGNAAALILQYKEYNQKITQKIYPQKIFLQKEINLSEINFVIQRLEPMKAPFPPEGKIDINNFLTQIKNLFPKHFVFNAPINCYKDKELPLLFSFSTPTATSFAGDKNILEKIDKISKNFSKKKIVFKPNDSAQAFGVFSVEIKNDGLNFAQIKNKNISELTLVQSYEMPPNLSLEEFNKIMDILYYVQFYKTRAKKDENVIANIAELEIKNGINSLYGDEILIQPFLEGVSFGDVRINLAKLSDENFHVVGAVFRKNISHDEKNFTTGFMSGRSTPRSVDECLTLGEQENLQMQIAVILQKLNNDLKEKYSHVTEIGCDFILAGNKKDVYFGEANHHCQGLLPLAEMTKNNSSQNNFYAKINGLNPKYDGGLAVVGEILKQQIILQNSII